MGEIRGIERVYVVIVKFEKSTLVEVDLLSRKWGGAEPL